MIQPPAYFGTLESHHGLPAGFLDLGWLFESSRGQNMLNPASGARGHFGMMPDVYRRENVDPMDLYASADWTAREAARAQKQFPGLDPVTAGAARHYGGPNTGIWGPRTTTYVNKFRKAYGMDPISNYDLVAAAGGDPSRRFRTIPGAPGAQSDIYSAGLAPRRDALLPALQEGPLLGASEYREPNLLADPRFWANFSAAIDPYMLPTQALGMGLAAGYAGIDARKAAFEQSLQRRQTLLQRQQELDEVRRQEEIQRQYDEEYLAYLTPEQRAQYLATGKVHRPAQEDLKVIVGPDGTPIFVPESMAVGKEASRPGPQVVIDKGGRTLAQEEAAREIEFAGKSVRTAGKGARDEEHRARLMQGMLERGLDTGWATPIASNVKKAFGLSDADVAKKEFFASQAGRYVFDEIGRSKGSTSEDELAYYESLSPEVTKTPEGNYLILEMARRIAFRNRDKATKWMQYVMEMGEMASLADFDQWYMDYHDRLPPFDPDAIIAEFRQKRGSRPINVPNGGRPSSYRSPPPPGVRVDQ